MSCSRAEIFHQSKLISQKDKIDFLMIYIYNRRTDQTTKFFNRHFFCNNFFFAIRIFSLIKSYIFYFYKKKKITLNYSGYLSYIYYAPNFWGILGSKMFKPRKASFNYKTKLKVVLSIGTNFKWHYKLYTHLENGYL